VAALTSSVQLGFVVGTLASAIFGAADRFDARRFFVVSALVAAVANFVATLVTPSGTSFIALRFITGVCMAGVYPIGMKMIGTWARGDLGLLIGLLVGALTLGSASPHLASALGGIDWRTVMHVASALAALGGIVTTRVPLGGTPPRRARFLLRDAFVPFKHPGLRLANLGYLGHMWELYAMWAWIGAFFHASFAARPEWGGSRAADIAAFGVIASGAVGCVLAGWLADRIGRTATTIGAMLMSGSCALLIGAAFSGPLWILLAVAMIWGASAVADSAQFSAAITELSDPATVGTALTIQVCAGFLLTIASIQIVGVMASLWGWHYAFGILGIGPFLGALAMLRLRVRPESARLANGRR